MSVSNRHSFRMLFIPNNPIDQDKIRPTRVLNHNYVLFHSHLHPLHPTDATNKNVKRPFGTDEQNFPPLICSLFGFLSIKGVKIRNRFRKDYRNWRTSAYSTYVWRCKTAPYEPGRNKQKDLFFKEYT